MKEVGERWLAASELRPTTYATCEATLRDLTPLGEMTLSNLGAGAIGDALREGSGASYQLHYGNAFTFWRWCARKGWCDVKVYDGVEKSARETAKPTVLLRVPEIRKRLRVAEKLNPEVARAYAIFLCTGIREAEAQRLLWSDFTEDVGVRRNGPIDHAQRR